MTERDGDPCPSPRARSAGRVRVRWTALRRLVNRGRVDALAIAFYCVGCAGMKPAGDERPLRSDSVTMEVIVKLTSEAVAADGEPRRRFERCARALGVTLSALHPDTTDSELASYLTTRVDAAGAEEVAARLRACPGVEGAYPKPAGEPPGRM